MIKRRRFIGSTQAHTQDVYQQFHQIQSQQREKILNKHKDATRERPGMAAF